MPDKERTVIEIQRSSVNWTPEVIRDAECGLFRLEAAVQARPILEVLAARIADLHEEAARHGFSESDLRAATMKLLVAKRTEEIRETAPDLYRRWLEGPSTIDHAPKMDAQGRVYHICSKCGAEEVRPDVVTG